MMEPDEFVDPLGQTRISILPESGNSGLKPEPRTQGSDAAPSDARFFKVALRTVIELSWPSTPSRYAGSAQPKWRKRLRAMTIAPFACTRQRVSSSAFEKAGRYGVRNSARASETLWKNWAWGPQGCSVHGAGVTAVQRRTRCGTIELIVSRRGRDTH